MNTCPAGYPAAALAAAIHRFIDDPGLMLEMAQNVPPVRTVAEHVDELEQVYRPILGAS